MFAKELVGVREITDLSVRIDGHDQGSMFHSGRTVDPPNDCRGLLIAAQALHQWFGDFHLGISIRGEQRGDGQQARHLWTLAAPWNLRRGRKDREGQVGMRSDRVGILTDSDPVQHLVHLDIDVSGGGFK